jgi:hypothetical protein
MKTGHIGIVEENGRDMKLQISGTGIAVTPELRRRIRRRVDFALGRFGGTIKVLSVRLKGEAGPPLRDPRGNRLAPSARCSRLAGRCGIGDRACRR